jgi:hypothetical protein
MKKEPDTELFWLVVWFLALIFAFVLVFEYLR